MKKTLKLLSMILLIIALPLIVACNKNDVDEVYPFDINDAVGTWMCIQSTDTYQGTSYDGLLVGTEITIKGDGTYTSTSSNFGNRGTFTFNGNKITAKNNTGTTFMVTASVKGDKMNWEGTSSEGVSFRYSFQKETIYDRLPAHFEMEDVSMADVLYDACNTKGEFCSITSDGKQFVFKSSSMKVSYINITDLNGFYGFYLGMSGLIVGLPNIPDMSELDRRVVCYDLACPNCFYDYSIAKPLLLKEEGIVTCTSCKRIYDLNNAGVVSNNKTGKALFCYKVSLTGTKLVVYN